MFTGTSKKPSQFLKNDLHLPGWCGVMECAAAILLSREDSRTTEGLVVETEDEVNTECRERGNPVLNDTICAAG